MSEKLITSVPGFSDTAAPKVDLVGDADIVIAQAEAAGEYTEDRDSAVDSYIRTIMDLADQGVITGGVDGAYVYDRAALEVQFKKMTRELNSYKPGDPDPMTSVPRILREAVSKLVLNINTASSFLNSVETGRWNKEEGAESQLDIARLSGDIGSGAVQLVQMPESNGSDVLVESGSAELGRTEGDILDEIKGLEVDLSDRDRAALWQYTIAKFGPEATSAYGKMSLGLQANRELMLRYKALYRELVDVRASRK